MRKNFTTRIRPAKGGMDRGEDEAKKRVAASILVVALLAWPSRGAVSSSGPPGLTPVPCASETWERGDPAFTALPGAMAFSGGDRTGAYQVEVPARWNGSIVLYAHGFTPATVPLLRVASPPIREHLIDRGFAWAASSFRCNGYVPGEALVDTMSLADRFGTITGLDRPRRVYLAGSSLGGHVTALGLHEFPAQFDGGLAMCASGPELFNYFAAVGAAAEAVTGIRFDRPDTVAATRARIAERLGSPRAMTAAGRQLAAIEIELSGGPRPFAVDGLLDRFIENVSGVAVLGVTTPAYRAATNTRYQYRIDSTLGLTTERLNALVRRTTGDPHLRSASGPYDEVMPFDGRIERPLLTMHGTGDLYVPIHLERTLRHAVSGAGREHLLAQRIYRIAGHCRFSRVEMERAFDDLVSWVETGRAAKGDDVLADLLDAGRAFTSPMRPGDPGTRMIGTTVVR